MFTDLNNILIEFKTIMIIINLYYKHEILDVCFHLLVCILLHIDNNANNFNKVLKYYFKTSATTL